MASTRREFLGAAGLAALGFRSQGRPILDTHTHFYDPTRPQGVPWPGKNDAALYRKVMPADFAALAKPLGVTGTVVVEASPWLEDNQWVLDLHRDQSFLVGLVGNLPPGTPAFPAQLARFAAQRAFRGIRIGQGALQKGLADAAFLEHLKLLAGRDLELDVNGGPGMLPSVASLAAKLPELRIVINHCANVKIDGKEPPAEWAKGMRDCAAARNVACKVSGLVEGTGRRDGTAPGDPAFYAPVLDVLWAAFGEDRLVFGSNWPVSEPFAPYARVLSVVAGYFEGKGKAAADKYFALNARAVYKPV
jgi:predicted TIM-barrel fold metal-dependent hydrolase